jgi:GxxExxY protein
MSGLLLKDEVYRIVGCAIEVHRVLGNGFLEAVYQEALEHELRQGGISFRSQAELSITYKDTLLRKTYCADLVCFDSIIVELKSMKTIGSIEEAQLINYLKATDLRVGLLLNFGMPGRLDWKRFVV